MYSPESSSKRHKKHKKDKYDEARYSGQAPTVSSGNARLKLILKVGGSSTPEHSDSPGPAMSHVVNVPYDDDSSSALSYAQMRKVKKKEKKKKKDKKHKHHKEKKRREREEMGINPMVTFLPISVVPIPMKPEVLETPESALRTDEERMEEGDQVPTDELPQTSETGVVIGSLESEAQVKQAPLSLQHQVALKPKVFDKISLQKLLEHLIRGFEKKDSHQVFAWPVTDKIAPGYSSIITKPMDLSTMRKKVERCEYETLTQFKDDFALMCNNAMKYNHIDTLYYKAAKKLFQSGSRILDEDKIRSLLPTLPFIRNLHEEQLGFQLFVNGQIETGAVGENLDIVSQSEEEMPEPICLDPTKSIHYQAPHPNDPPDLCGAFSEDATTEEILQQARLAAREAANRLASKKPHSAMGFLRQRDDGTTSLAILTPSNGVLPGTREQPVSLGVLTGKIPHGGATQLQIQREDKKTYPRAAKPLNYGPFSSFAPSHDSTFAGLSADEQELVQATYGDDTAVQYADSIIEFAKGCDYAMRMVDEVLDTLTKGEHSRTVGLIQERKKMDEEEAILKQKQEAFDASIREEWKFVEEMGLPPSGPVTEAEAESQQEQIDFDGLKSLETDLGLDMKFLEELKPSCISSASGKLEETATLIENLEKLQHERLSLPTLPQHPYVQPPSENEVQLADRVTENLIELVKQTIPGGIVSEASLHEAMGINLNAFNYQTPKPCSEFST